jgi:NAD(P)-dependent dehydrogenase (short-subunit alcohol dehydrogenase family)
MPGVVAVSELSIEVGDLHGLVAVVTGAASGIGAACVRAMALQGAKVICADVLEPEDSRWPATSLTRVRCDVSAEDDVSRLAEEAARHGGADILVNCAGIGSTTDTIGTDSDTWDRVFAVNSRGTFLTCRALLPQMIANGRGSIVNIASVAGLVGLRDRAAYCASKGAVIALTRAIAVDHVSQGIRSNAVCPGTVDSPWVHRLVEEVGISLDGLRARQPMGRLGTADEIAAMVAFLAGPRSSFTTGAVITVDGGLTAA